jgi:hypothetical protein|tara:strand:+ start:114 stop:410 length:297 start_codon:yes stop_codon:yes gene_type:complete
MSLEGSVGAGEIGPVVVHTTNNRGHSPEEIAEMCVNKIMHVSQDAPLHVREQALAYRDKVKAVVVEYMKRAIQSDRTTLWNVLKKEGFHEEAEIIRRL